MVGVGRNPERLQQALQKGLITDWVQEISVSSIPKDSLGVVCLPVDQIPQMAVALLRAGCSAVTDAGSTKQTICERLRGEQQFVGAHLIAGSEQAGFEHADAQLFQGARLCVMPVRSKCRGVAAGEWLLVESGFDREGAGTGGARLDSGTNEPFAARAGSGGCGRGDR